MLKILIVEDDEITRELYNELFIESGYQTFLVEDIESALSKIHRFHPDLIILDMQLPGGKSGLDLIMGLKNLKIEIPIFIISGKTGMRNDPEICFSRYVKRFFDKPVDLDMLLFEVRHLFSATCRMVKKELPVKDNITKNHDIIVGGIFANCKIESFLSRGYFGLMYKGKHVSLDINVAIKILDPTLSRSKEEEDRFLKEIHILSQLEDKNLIQILDAGKNYDLSYVVMRYINGETLQNILDKNPKPFNVKKAAKIILEAAKGLKVAHGVDLIHRDIKPSNILIGSDGGITLIDFGVSTAYKKDKSEKNKNGIKFTSPFYMSPEQCLGVGVTKQSDIYSLGATFYHMVTGIPPFREKSSMETMIAHTTKKAIPPNEINRDMNEEASEIIMKMLEKAPSKRYKSAEKLIKKLEKFIA